MSITCPYILTKLKTIVKKIKKQSIKITEVKNGKEVGSNAD